MKKNRTDVESLSFEQALARLEAVVQELEDGQTGLSEALSRYEEGVGLLKHCHRTLSQVERKISLLTQIAPDGTAVAEPFDEQAMTLQEKQASRSKRRSHQAAAKRAASPAGRDGPTEGAEELEADSESDIDRQRGLF